MTETPIDITWLSDGYFFEKLKEAMIPETVKGEGARVTFTYTTFIFHRKREHLLHLARTAACHSTEVVTRPKRWSPKRIHVIQVTGKWNNLLHWIDDVLFIANVKKEFSL